MISKRKLGVVVSAVAIGGAALTVALSAGAAHAQPVASISLTSAIAAATIESGNNPPLGGQDANLTFSVTCPVGDSGEVQATASEGGTGTGHTNLFTCTGNPQSVSVTAVSSTSDFAAGQVFVGAALDINPPLNELGNPYGYAAGLASIVPIQQY